MKYVIVILVIAVVAYLALSRRPSKPLPRKPQARVDDPGAKEIVQCMHCGVHLPRGEALVDARGLFCSEAHRLAGPR